METFSWLAIVGPYIILALIFLFRKWLVARIERSVQHSFDEKLERLRTELRASEEKLKSNLRDKEAEISAMREKILSGRTERQLLLDKRRMDAVERVWEAVMSLGPLKMISGMMAVLKYENVAKAAAADPKMRQVFEIIVGPVPLEKFPKDPAINEKPFVSPPAWAYLSAYRAIVVGAYTRAKLLSLGTGGDIFDEKKIQEMLKVALPHQAAYIDKHGHLGFHYLLDELEEKLLAELRKMLEGHEADQQSIEMSAQLLKMVNAVSQQRAEATVMAAAAKDTGDDLAPSSA